MTDMEKALLIEASVWYNRYFRFTEEEDFSLREIVLDICDSVGLELEDDELDEVEESLEELEGMR